MAVKNHIKKQVRNLTVCYQNRNRSGGSIVKVPWINLSGFWLSDAGFAKACRVKVRVMQDCIVLTRESEQENQMQIYSTNKEVKKTAKK